MIQTVEHKENRLQLDCLLSEPIRAIRGFSFALELILPPSDANLSIKRLFRNGAYSNSLYQFDQRFEVA
jgi:hypothetical protein